MFNIPTAQIMLQRFLLWIIYRKEFHTDRNSMNAYVVFKEKSNAEKALEW